MVATRRNTNRKSPSAQLGRNSQPLASAELIAARRRVAQLEAEAAARANMTPRQLASHRKKLAAAADRELLAKLSELRDLGLYNPRPHETAEGIISVGRELLTPSRRRAINAKYRQAEELAKGAVFAPMPASFTPQQRREVRAEIERAGGRVTKRGVFLPRAERELQQPRGRLTFDKGLQTYVVRVKKTVGRGANRREITETRPLAGHEALERLQSRFVKRFDKEPFNPKNERLRFVIHGQNISRRSFRSLAEMFEYAKGYRKGERAQATFMDSLTIIRVRRMPDTNGKKGEWLLPVRELDGATWRGPSRKVRSSFGRKIERNRRDQ